MKKNGNESSKIFRRIILVFVLSSAVAALLVGSTLKYMLTRATLDSWKQQQEFVTLEFAEQIDSEIEETLNHLRFLATLPEFSTPLHIDQIEPSLKGVPENVEVTERKILNNLLELDKRFSALYVLTPKGQLYLLEPFKRQIKVKRENFSHRPYFIEVSRTKKPVVSDGFISGAGTPVVVMVVPVLDKAGNITRYLGGGTYFTNLSRLVAKDQIGSFDSGFIVDRKGSPIAHTNIKNFREHSGEDYSAHPLILNFPRKDGKHNFDPVIEEYVNPGDGRVYLSSYVQLHSGWGLGLDIAKDTVLSKILPMVWEISILVSILVLEGGY